MRIIYIVLSLIFLGHGFLLYLDSVTQIDYILALITLTLGWVLNIAAELERYRKL